jgi:hypothetical protein
MPFRYFIVIALPTVKDLWIPTIQCMVVLASKSDMRCKCCLDVCGFIKLHVAKGCLRTLIGVINFLALIIWSKQ